MKTIREIIAEKLLELRDIDGLGASRASEILVELSALLGSINKECSDRRYIYSLKKIMLLDEHKTVTKAVTYGEGSKEYKDWSEAEEYRKAVIENIRSLKYYLRNSLEEKRESVY